MNDGLRRLLSLVRAARSPDALVMRIESFTALCLEAAARPGMQWATSAVATALSPMCTPRPVVGLGWRLKMLLHTAGSSRDGEPSRNTRC
jgi:hypothetical protein